jgi:hypothetical protein
MNEAEFGEFIAAVEPCIDEFRAFMTAFLPKPTAVKADADGQGRLATMFVKELAAGCFYAFPGEVPRSRLIETLEDSAAHLRAAPMERLQ